MSKEVIRNNRFFVRPLEDYESGAMTSLHSIITLDKETHELRGTIYLRDCYRQISFEFWAGNGAWPNSSERMEAVIGKLKLELDEFAADFNRAVKELEDE